MNKILFSDEAINDLQEIKKYISEDLLSETSATNVVKDILNNIHNLEIFPLSGVPLSSIIDFSTNYRFIICGSYNVFYRYEDGMVYIVRIIYGKRDYMKILFNNKQ